MSKNFVTKSQLIRRVRYTGSSLTPSDEFATTDQCILAGADPDMLIDYANTQYPIDDHVEKMPFEQILPNTSLKVMRSWGLDKNFYPSDKFRLSFTIVPGSRGYTLGVIFSMYNSSSQTSSTGTIGLGGGGDSNFFKYAGKEC